MIHIAGSDTRAFFALPRAGFRCLTLALSLINGEKRVRWAALTRLGGMMGGALRLISGSSELVRGVALAGMGEAGALRRRCTVGRNERLGSGVGLWMFCLGVGVVLWVFCLGVSVVLLFFCLGFSVGLLFFCVRIMRFTAFLT